MPKYSKGDHLVYPGSGVVEVIDFQTKDIAGEDLLFYILQVAGAPSKVWVPEQKEDLLRELISSEQVEEVLEILRDPPTSKKGRGHWRRRTKLLAEMLKGTLLDVAEVLRETVTLNHRNTLATVERRLMDTAMRLISEELALVQGKPVEQMQDELQQMILASKEST